MLDQADELRKLVNPDSNMRKSKIITVTSGKGGVGKSNFVVNLGIKLQQKGNKVLIFDADLGMGNDDVLMGLYPKYNIFDTIFTNLNIQDIIVKGDSGVSLVPAGSGLNAIHELTSEQRENFFKKLGDMEEFDYILMDTGAGISRDVLFFISASEELIIITTPEPTSITDAYSLIKATDHFKLKDKAKIVVNKAFTVEEGLDIYQKFDKAVSKFLGIRIEYLGCIIDDKKLVQSVRKQKPVVELYPNSTVSKNIDTIAIKLMKNDVVKSNDGFKELFKRMFNVFS